MHANNVNFNYVGREKNNDTCEKNCIYSNISYYITKLEQHNKKY